MNRRPTRRAVGKLLIGAPVAFSFRLFPAEAPKRPTPASRTLSPRQRNELQKSLSQLRKALQELRKMPVPMGSEPAFVFGPLLPRK